MDLITKIQIAGISGRNLTQRLVRDIKNAPNTAYVTGMATLCFDSMDNNFFIEDINNILECVNLLKNKKFINKKIYH